MVEEKKFKEELIKLLNSLNNTNEWIDGDKEITPNKKSDIVNHKSKVVIEIKDDTLHKTIIATSEEPFVTSTTDLSKMNQILSDHIRSTRLKFKNYRDYKTILLIRTDHVIMRSIRYAIDGLHTFTRDSYKGRSGKYTHHIRENIGCFIICDYQEIFYYIPNPYCKSMSNTVKKTQAEEIFVRKIDEIEQV